MVKLFACWVNFHVLIFFKINFFQKIIRVWNGLDPNQDQKKNYNPDLVQTVCKGYQQTTKVAASKERVNKKLTSFLLKKPLVKSNANYKAMVTKQYKSMLLKQYAD